MRLIDAVTPERSHTSCARSMSALFSLRTGIRPSTGTITRAVTLAYVLAVVNLNRGHAMYASQ
ncbi:MAG: hypothetical protein HY898_27315 [Deltaproteobacteria bacterium]|nr:hypothetical protein [Deltaproteobacteria bacterium]